MWLRPKALFTLFILFIFCSLHSLAQTEIKFQVKGVSDTTSLLAYRFGSRVFVKDTVFFNKKGLGVYESKKPLGGGVYMLVLPNKQTFIEFLVSGDQSFSLKTDTSDLVKNMLVEGSDDNTLFYQYRQYVDPKGQKLAKLNEDYQGISDKSDPEAKKLEEEMTSLNKEINQFREKVIAEQPNMLLGRMFRAMKEIDVPEPPILENGRPDSTFQYRYYKAHYFDNIDLSDSSLLRTPIFEEKLKFYFEKLVLQFPDSVNKEADWIIAQTRGNKEMFRFILQTLTIKYERSKLMGAENIFVHLVQEYYTKDQAYWLDSAQLARIQKRGNQLAPIIIGEKAPNLIMLDYYNQPQVLWNIEADYIVMYFWAFDCGHCKKVTPKLKALYEELKDRGVKVFAVSTKQEEASWRDYIDKNKLDWINCHDIGGRNRIHELYDIFSTPTIYLLDKDKKIMAKRVDVASLRNILYQELGIPIPKGLEEEADDESESEED